MPSYLKVVCLGPHSKGEQRSFIIFNIVAFLRRKVIVVKPDNARRSGEMKNVRRPAGLLSPNRGFSNGRPPNSPGYHVQIAGNGPPPGMVGHVVSAASKPLGTPVPATPSKSAPVDGKTEAHRSCPLARNAIPFSNAKNDRLLPGRDHCSSTMSPSQKKRTLVWSEGTKA